MDRHLLFERFHKIYASNKSSSFSFFAPGRVNLIGEHTDYTLGLVMPIAIQLGTVLIISKNNHGILRFTSLNVEEKTSVPANANYSDFRNAWYKYPLGIFQAFKNSGFDGQGFDMLYYGDLPTASGLSSSASIEMVTAVALNQLYQSEFDTIELVKMAQWSENNFVSLNCGIMDMFASGMGKAGYAIALNCSDLSFQYVEAEREGYHFVIGNSMKKRGLADSKYNERVSECGIALEILKKADSFSSLSEVSLENLDKYGHMIENDTIFRRTRHVVLENERVRRSIHYLGDGNMYEFGQLMNQSHQSLKLDYEVTGFELDTMVEKAQTCEGVLGSRMTGAGFGGCMISLLESNYIEPYIHSMTEHYFNKTGLQAEFYSVHTSDGASLKELL
ncbi:MAG: galactokinase [Bacteroidales bacterium]|nr:galactokinase [Bacteroidales bacterium]